LREGAQHVLDINEKYAKKIGVNLAARTTCVKPEGSASLVLGSSSGIHARHAEFYIRRIRMNKGDPLANYLSYVTPDLVENDKFSSSGVVVSIPQKSPSGAIIRHDETAMSLLSRTLDYNNNWVSPGHRHGDNKHNVSVTISVKDDEWDSLREAMWDNRDSYSGISLLPFDGGTYIQAPFEDCTKETYLEMLSKIKDVDLSKIVEEQDNTNRAELLACSGSSCEFI
jgi:ribonucleoside-diphosphate reductase alpha chain